KDCGLSPQGYSPWTRALPPPPPEGSQRLRVSNRSTAVAIASRLAKLSTCHLVSGATRSCWMHFISETGADAQPVASLLVVPGPRRAVDERVDTDAEGGKGEQAGAAPPPPHGPRRRARRRNPLAVVEQRLSAEDAPGGTARNIGGKSEQTTERNNVYGRLFL